MSILSSKLAAASLLAGALVASAATAQTTPPADSAKTKADSAKPKGPPFITVHTDLGYVNTSGNTEVQTLNFTDQVVMNTSPVNKITQQFSVVYGTNQNKVQTSLWGAGVKDEYSFTKNIGLYGLFNWDRNTFAGIDYRYEEGAGVAFIPINSPRNRLEFDLGFSYFEVHSTFPDSLGMPRDSSDNYAAIRTAVVYRHTFIKDYRVNSQTDVVAPLSKHIAVKLGYTIRYANLPPPGFKTTDRLFTSDLQFTF
jgi:putative salt-induced outer membrane protein